MAKADCASCWKDPGLEFSSAEVGPTSRPAFPASLDHPCLEWLSRLAWGASTSTTASTSYPPATQIHPQHRFPLGFLSALVVSCQVRVPRTGPGPAGELEANAPGRKAVSREGAEMGSETCLLRASSVKGSAGGEGQPPHLRAPSIAWAIN